MGGFVQEEACIFLLNSEKNNIFIEQQTYNQQKTNLFPTPTDQLIPWCLDSRGTWNYQYCYKILRTDVKKYVFVLEPKLYASHLGAFCTIAS